MRLLAAFLLALSAATLHAQSMPLEMQLPEWAIIKWEPLATAAALKLTGRLNPFLQRGDFDDDGKIDLALFVASTKTGKSGIAILHGGSRAPSVLFAGKSLDNGGDTLDWVDIWNVQDKGSLQYGINGSQYQLKRDTLLLVKESSASALLPFENGRYTWQQQGD
jgi:hypothetical protein